jgi:hypothetical protein
MGAIEIGGGSFHLIVIARLVFQSYVTLATDQLQASAGEWKTIRAQSF